MKLNLSGGILLLLLGPAAADPALDRRPRVPLDTSAVMSISIDGSEPRAPTHLRDALRQPFDGVDDPFKPYRLSVEERQRMREQLRSHPSQANQKK